MTTNVAQLQRVAVVGASLAGLRATQALRRRGFDGALTLLGAEREPPYDRPPLSKEVLAGEWEPDQAVLPLDDLDVDLRLGCEATGLNLRTRTVQTTTGDVPFDGLVIATGARPRHLPGTAGLEGVHVLRTLADCVAIRDAFERGPRVAVIGAGFIGCEVAATARQRGLDVTLIEALDVPLMRVVGTGIGKIVGAVHRDRGVDVRAGVGVDRVEGDERVERIVLTDGTNVEADVVVVGIGVVPNTDWLSDSGIPVEDGVVCDTTCAVLGTDNVVAAGDVARWPNVLFGESMRVEHWTNAVEQADAAAQRLLAGAGGAEPFAPVPYFWSDQYDMKIQYVGTSRPDDKVMVVEGSVPDRKFVAAFGRDGMTVGAIAFNRPRPLMQVRQLIAEGARFPPKL